MERLWCIHKSHKLQVIADVMPDNVVSEHFKSVDNLPDQFVTLILIRLD